METVVLYTSHYGATKQYATALAAALGAPCFALGTEDAQAVRSAGRIVYGGGLYAGGVAGLGKAKKYFPGKDVFLFTVGLAAAQRPEVRAEIEGQVRRGLGQQSLAPGHLFCLRGAFCFDKLGAVHKTMMRMMRRMLLKKGDAMTQDDRDLLAAYDTPVDFTDVSALAPLVRACGAVPPAAWQG